MNARLPWVVVCAGILLAGHTLIGQTIGVISAPPPPSPPPASPLIPKPPLPMGTPIEQLPRFEVDSVKKFEGRVTSMTLRTPGGGRISVVALPLRTIIMQAFGGLRDYQITGGPGWLTTDRFSITAKAETNAPRDQLMLMLRALLVERFQFKFRVEKREMQAYVLTTADGEWKPTARMKPMDCSAKPAALPSGPIRPDQMPCGSTSFGTNGIQARGVTMASFVSILGSIGGLGMIHDRTGLTGTYHIELDASPTALLRASTLSSALAGNPSSENLLPSVAEGRSLGAAVRDLGLKLDRQKESVEVLVIESVSQPDED